MNLRFAAMIAGCLLVGAGAAAYHRADGRPAAPAALATERTPLFMQAATGAPTSPSWPPRASVAFYEETFALLTIAATPRPAAAPAATPPVVRNDSDTVEIVIRDRFGRPIRVERVDRRLLAGGRGYPPPHRSYGAQPYGPYGPYQPYGPYGPYGPYRR